MSAEHTPEVYPGEARATAGWRAGARRSALAVLGAVVVSWWSGTQAQGPKTTDQLSSELIALVAEYQAASDAGDRARVLDEAATLIGVRRARLAKLVEDDPAAVLRVVLPKKHRDALPPALQALIEQEEQVDGELEVLYEDGPRGGRVHHQLVTRERRLALRFARRMPGLPSGTKVRVKGVRVGDALALGDSSVEALALASTNTFGEQRTMVLLVNFQDNPGQPYSVATAQDVVFNQAGNFYRESSFQQAWLAGDVYGWFTLPVSVNTCDVNAIGTSARQAAQAAGIDVYSYQRWVFVFPKNACGWLGFASLGGGTMYGSPSKAWINGSLNAQTVRHEIGHNFGLWHAHAVGCSDGTAGIDLHSGCFLAEYGDTIDNMGYATGYWDAFNKEQLGWLNYGSSPPITPVQSPGGTYSIDTYETQTGSPKALKIARPDGSYFYVESRQAIGADAFLASSPQALSGVFIRIATPGVGNSGVLYDMTPVTTPWVFTDGALGVGQTFTDTISGISITTLAAGAGGASVAVSYGSAPPSCAPAAPTVTLSPATQSVAAGGTVSFAVSITNHNSAGCAASNFSLQSQVPPGWTATLGGGPTMTVNPGATGSTVMQATSSSSAAVGLYTATIGATDSIAPNHSGSASGSIAIEPTAPSCSRAVPTVTLSPGQVSTTPGGSTSFAVSVTNNNSASCGTSSFNLSSSVPSGWTGSLSGSPLSIEPGASRSATLQVNAPASAGAGSYTAWLVASESGQAGNSASASATITVQTTSSCTLTPPTVTLSPSQASTSPGGAVTLTVSVTNRNSAACGAANFNLAAAAMSGWTTSLGAPVLTVSPGASGSTTLQVTSPASAAAGTYPVSVIGTQSGNASNGGAASATITVQTGSSCTAVAPAVTLSPAQASIVAGGAATLTVSVTNHNSSTCGVSTYSVVPGVPAGWSASLGSSTLSLGPGGTGTTTLQAAAPASTAAGSYTVLTSVTENSGSASTLAAASAAATIVVQTVQPAALNVTLSSDQASYRRGATAHLIAMVTAGGAPVASAPVVFTVMFPDGRSVTQTKNTDNNGKAKFDFRIKSNYPTGTYSATASATRNGVSGSAATSFPVR